MNQKMGRLIRYILFIQKLSGLRKYVPVDDIIFYLTIQMEVRGFAGVGISQRTLQRDICEIREMFEVDIKNKRGKGYYIASKSEHSEIRYEELLMNFDLLTSLNEDSQASGFIIPEHHRPKGSENIPTFIRAIKDQSMIEFKYTLVRKDDAVITKTVKPYFLKESLGLWYLLAIDEKDRLRSYGVDRISDIHITDFEFKRDESINPDELFKNSYGIWDDPSIPIEEVELSYSPLDGKFLKAKPLHSSQVVLADNDSEFRIRLKIRVTNDFVMALLARSASLTVISPESLRVRIHDIYAKALERNSTT